MTKRKPPRPCERCKANTASPQSRLHLCADCAKINQREKQIARSARLREQLNQRMREYRAKNRERIREIQRRSYYANLDKVRSCYQANREKILSRNRQWHKNNKGRCGERKRRYEATEARRAFRQAHRNEILSKKDVLRARKFSVAVIEYVDRAQIIERDNATCYLWCKRKLRPEEITMDHVVPFSRGGSHTADNVRVACLPCNARKHNKLLSELNLEAA